MRLASRCICSRCICNPLLGIHCGGEGVIVSSRRETLRVYTPESWEDGEANV